MTTTAKSYYAIRWNYNARFVSGDGQRIAAYLQFACQKDRDEYCKSSSWFAEPILAKDQELRKLSSRPTARWRDTWNGFSQLEI